MTVQAAGLRKLIARFDPPLSRMWAAELCGSGAQVSAVAIWRYRGRVKS